MGGVELVGRPLRVAPLYRARAGVDDQLLAVVARDGAVAKARGQRVLRPQVHRVDELVPGGLAVGEVYAPGYLRLVRGYLPDDLARLAQPVDAEARGLPLNAPLRVLETAVGPRNLAGRFRPPVAP